MDKRKYYYEISDAFSFGLFKSSVALCRALLELVLFDELYKRKSLGQVKSGSM